MRITPSISNGAHIVIDYHVYRINIDHVLTTRPQKLCGYHFIEISADTSERHGTPSRFFIRLDLLHDDIDHILTTRQAIMRKKHNGFKISCFICYSMSVE